MSLLNIYTSAFQIDSIRANQFIDAENGSEIIGGDVAIISESGVNVGGSTLNGQNIISAGSNNVIIGDGILNIGDLNNITGNDNAVIGSSNTVLGIGNFTTGDNNNITGNDNITMGNSNTISSGNCNYIFANNSSTSDSGVTIFGDSIGGIGATLPDSMYIRKDQGIVMTTGSNPLMSNTKRNILNAIQTTNDTPTVLFSTPMVANSSKLFLVEIVGISLSGSPSTNTMFVHKNMYSAAYDGAVATFISPWEQEYSEIAGTSITLTNTTTDFNINVVGLAGWNIRWHGHIQINYNYS